MDKTLLIAIVFAGIAASFSAQADALRVYGPGGPAPAMREAAAAFEQKTGRAVAVVAGPTPQWIDKAKQDADIVFSGSETMMTDFVTAMAGRIEASQVEPLYLRAASILVRPGNPLKLQGLGDLFKPGRRILVVNGAGQNGLWEDMAGRTGDIDKVRSLRKNIVVYARNSAEARQAWIDDPTLEAWIIWNIWQVANPKLADVVTVEEPYRIYRDTGVAITKSGREDKDAEHFVRFLQSAEGAAIFARWGWTTKAT